jgi:hypothetical protein
MNNLRFVIAVIVVTSLATLYYFSVTEANRLMLFGETVSVYCEDHTEHINILCRKNTEFKYFA